MKEKLYGFRSQLAVQAGHPTAIYATTEGREVEVGIVAADPEGKAIAWPDKQFLGELKTFIRAERPDRVTVFRRGKHRQLRLPICSLHGKR